MQFRLGPRPGTARRFAPRIATPLRAFGARRRVAMRRYFLVKGGGPPFTLSPELAGSEQSSLPLVFSGRVQRGPCLGSSRFEDGAVESRLAWIVSADPVGAHPGTARRFAPGIATPLRASGARRRVAMRRYFLVKGGGPPFTLSPELAGSEQSSLPLVFSGRVQRGPCLGSSRFEDGAVESRLVWIVSADPVGAHPGTARRFAPGIATRLRAAGARRRVTMRRYLLGKGASLFPPSQGCRQTSSGGGSLRGSRRSSPRRSPRATVP